MEDGVVDDVWMVAAPALPLPSEAPFWVTVHGALTDIPLDVHEAVIGLPRTTVSGCTVSEYVGAGAGGAAVVCV